MICFEPNDEQRLLRDAVAQFAKTCIRPRMREIEKLREAPEDLRKAAHEMGLGLMQVPRAQGGQGLPLTTSVLIEEELGHADAGAAFGLAGPGAMAFALTELGTEEQKNRYLASFTKPDGHSRFGAVAWSEAKPHRERFGFSTIARKVPGGFLLSGTKSFVDRAGVAQTYVVFAQVEEARGWEGIGAFVVEADNPGLRIGERHATLGLDAAHFGEIVLDGAQVGEDARLLPQGDFTLAVLRFFSKHSLVVAARAVGVARAAFELARDYCETRVAFGKPIGHFQAVAFTLAGRLMDVESARSLVLRAAWAWDAGLPELEAIAMTANAVAHAQEACMRAADDAVQLHGGSGFMRDYPVEKLMRDAKQLALCMQTGEQADQVFGAIALSTKLDPALVLPTPETQAVFT